MSTQQNKPICFIACDPGKTGSWCYNIPETKTIGFKDNRTSLVEQAELLNKIKDEYNVRILVIEDVHSLGNASAKSNFIFGYNVGVVNTLATLSRHPLDIVQPKVWQKAIGIPGKKWPKGTANSVRSKWLKTAIAEKVIALYPYSRKQLYGPKGGLYDGRADALGISHYARLTYTI